MPAYNEKEAIRAVVTEWLSVLDKEVPSFRLIVLDDGSIDGTADQLSSVLASENRLAVIKKENSGHGQTCVLGYHEAIASGAEWILQVDSDGQCDPRHLKEFWQAKQKGMAIQGYRRIRGDGALRMMISTILSAIIFAMTGKYLRDANVPYRIMDRLSLEQILNYVPKDFYLANILVSYLYAVGGHESLPRWRHESLPSVAFRS
jgi:glycosyltransferase involved in cell wall biosynthesis